MPEKVYTKFQDGGRPGQGKSAETAGKKRKAAEAFRPPARQFQSNGGSQQTTKTVTFDDRPRQQDQQNGTHSTDHQVSNRLGHQGVTPSLKKRAAELLSTRKTLPIFDHRSEICECLRQKRVLLLVGETGSGKSTQMPQFLIDEPWCKRTKKVGGCIAITQPRRVAAISLARRVAEEMGTPLGKSSPASQVGYSVRFDNSTSPSTRIKFLTEGMLLQEMLRDPWLKEYSAVVVDEVHERGVNVDLVLGFLKKMQAEHGPTDGRGGTPMKVVVMSATGNMKPIKEFFEGREDRLGAVSGDDFKAAPQEEKQDSIPEWPGISDVQQESAVATYRIEGRQYPVKTFYSQSPVSDVIDAALQRIFHIHVHEPLPGDILVFLTGQETVENLETLCHEYAHTLDLKSVPKLLILPLFAALPQSAQQRVFEPTPPRTRKVIIATNIAETCVTVPGVRFVIDGGKCKKKQFSSRLGLDSLLVKSISRSAANQRKGRAGREAPGTCYRLYTEATYLTFEPDNDPEILRCDLTQMALSLKARGVEDVLSFPLLTPPKRANLEKALLHLLQLNALEANTGQITPLGHEIAHLPVTPALGSVLLAASGPEYACLDESIDIISALSVENVFLSTTTEEKKEQADSARRELYRREGDHLTLLATVQAYVSENSDRKEWCEKRFVSHRAMKAVIDVRRQLTEILRGRRKVGARAASTAADDIDLHDRILKAFLTGFLGSTALLMPDGTYKTVMGKQTVAIHPSSVLFGRKVEAIMYNEFVFTQKTYARGVSTVQMNWVSDALGDGGI